MSNEDVSSFVYTLSFCQEKATATLYFGRIRTRFGVSISSFSLNSLTFSPS